MSEKLEMSIPLLARKTKHFFSVHSSQYKTIRNNFKNKTYVQYLDFISTMFKATSYKDYELRINKKIYVEDFIYKILDLIVSLNIEENNEIRMTEEEMEFMLSSFKLFITKSHSELEEEMWVLYSKTNIVELLDEIIYKNYHEDKCFSEPEFLQDLNVLNFYKERLNENLISDIKYYYALSNAIFIRNKKYLKNINFEYRYIYLLKETKSNEFKYFNEKLYNEYYMPLHIVLTLKESDDFAKSRYYSFKKKIINEVLVFNDQKEDVEKIWNILNYIVENIEDNKKKVLASLMMSKQLINEKINISNIIDMINFADIRKVSLNSDMPSTPVININEYLISFYEKTENYQELDYVHFLLSSDHELNISIKNEILNFKKEIIDEILNILKNNKSLNIIEFFILFFNVKEEDFLEC